MDFGEEAREGQAAVAGEGVGHAARGGHDAGRCEEEAHEGEDEQADGAGLVAGGGVEDLEEGPGGGGDDVVDVAANEEEDHQEDEAGEDADADAGDHDLGPFD